MNLSSLAIKRPVATIMLMLMVVVVGFYSLMGIPQDLFPDVEYPVALVMTSYSNASPEEVETMITEPIEEALASVEGLDQMQSITMQGSSIVMVQFQMNTDMNFASLNMREKIALITDYLPKDAGAPMVIKMDMSSIPIVQLYVSGDMPLSDLNTEIEDNVLSYIERVAGVASVDVYGAVEEEVAIQISQEKLSGYGLTLAQIAQTLAAENVNMPSGNVSKGSTEIIVRTIGEFESAESIKDLPITLSDRSIIRLGEIAQISQQYQDQESISRIDGKTAIGLMITKQSDANTVATARDIQKTITELEQKFPELTFTIGFNQADFIEKSISSVATSAIAGAVLAVLVVFLFLKNVRSTLVIAISIPVSLLATFALMNARGMSLNLITLCSLTLAIGMLVDNSIVVLENIFRLRQESYSAIEAARKGSGEIFLAVSASTLTTVVVFLPIALSGGMTGLMFKDFCFTIIIALLASLVVAVTVVPMLCSKLLSKGLSTDYIRIGTRRYKFKVLPKFTKFIENVTENYEIFERKALKKRKRVVIACILLFVISISLVAVVGTELLPATDEGSFTISVDTPYGTSLKDKDGLMSQIEEYVFQISEMEHCTVNIGTTNMMTIGDDSSTLSVTLIDKSERKRSTADIVKKAKKDLSNIVGADITVEESSSMGSMTGSSTDLSLMIKGKELNDLEIIGNDLCDKISHIKNVTSAELDVTEGNPEVKVILNRNTAAYYGITASQLASGLSTALSGSTATNLKINGNEIEVNLSLPDSYANSIDNMKQIMLSGTTGLQVPIGQVATLEFDNSPSAVNRLNQQRFVTLNVDIDAKDLNGVSTQIFKVVDAYHFPDGYYYETGGQQKEMMEAFTSLLKALAVALALVYLLLAAQFESLTLPFMIMMSVPFAMSGAFLALFITGTALSMVSFLGLIMLAGIVVNNAILLVEFINQNKLVMGRDEALIQAGKMRLRPIIMSSATTCVGMIPLALGVGEGNETLAPMAISVIGGLMASTLVTLILMPVLYAIFDNRKLKKDEKHRIHDEKVAGLEAKWLSEDSQK